MKKLLLATVAVIALGSGGVVAAENSGKAAAGMSAGTADVKGKAAVKSETTGSGAASDSNADVKPGAKSGTKAGTKSSTTSGAKSSDTASDKAGAKTPGRADRNGASKRSETTGAGSNDDMKVDRAHSDRTNKRNETTGAGPGEPKADSNAIKSDNGTKAGGRSDASHSGSAGGSVSLTADQKTRIRTTVIESRNAPKVERSKINFSLNIGTVVPRSIHVVAVPPTLVEIHPAWRGYMYFVVGDELVVVEPGTLRIVAIFAV